MRSFFPEAGKKPDSDRDHGISVRELITGRAVVYIIYKIARKRGNISKKWIVKAGKYTYD